MVGGAEMGRGGPAESGWRDVWVERSEMVLKQVILGIRASRPIVKEAKPKVSPQAAWPPFPPKATFRARTLFL